MKMKNGFHDISQGHIYLWREDSLKEKYNTKYTVVAAFVVFCLFVFFSFCVFVFLGGGLSTKTKRKRNGNETKTLHKRGFRNAF